MTAECLGSERAIMYKHRTNHTYHTQDDIAQRLVAVDCKLKVGQKQSFTFLENDPPPFYAPNTPKYDIKEGEKVTQRGYVGCRKGTKQLLFERGLWRPGMVASITAKQHAAGKIAELHCEKTVGLPAHTQPPPHASPPKPTHTHTHTHDVARHVSDSPCAAAVVHQQVLGNCPDFRDQPSLLQMEVESRGHILVMSPKSHPEVAGVGVE